MLGIKIGSSINILVITGRFTTEGQAGVIRSPYLTSSALNLYKHLEMRGMGGNI